MRVPAVVLFACFLLLVGAVPACTSNQLVGDLALVTDGGDDEDGGVDNDDDGGVEDDGDGGPRDGGGDNLQAIPLRAR